RKTSGHNWHLFRFIGTPLREGRILLLPPSRKRTSTPSPPPQEERAGERRPTLWNTPLPRPSPRSFLAGRGRTFLVVVSRCALTRIAANSSGRNSIRVNSRKTTDPDLRI